MNKGIMDTNELRKPFSFSLPPLLVARAVAMTTDKKDPEMLNRNRSAAIEILIRRGMKAGR